MEMKKLEMKKRVNLELRNRAPEKVRTNPWEEGNRRFLKIPRISLLVPRSCQKRAAIDALGGGGGGGGRVGGLSSRAAAGPVSFDQSFQGLLSRARPPRDGLFSARPGGGNGNSQLAFLTLSPASTFSPSDPGAA